MRAMIVVESDYAGAHHQRCDTDFLKQLLACCAQKDYGWLTSVGAQKQSESAMDENRISADSVVDSVLEGVTRRAIEGMRCREAPRGHLCRRMISCEPDAERGFQ